MSLPNLNGTTTISTGDSITLTAITATDYSLSTSIYTTGTDINYDYQLTLENIPIEEIERFLRKKKLENIHKDVE